MVLVNPAAGRSAYRNILGRVLEVLYQGNWLPTVYFIRGPQAVELPPKSLQIRPAGLPGGDGTLSDVISG
jgi:hypothetical protein